MRRMVALAAAVLLGCAHSGNRPAPIFVDASQTGQITLDQGDGGGNPFASAFVELAGRDALSTEAPLVKTCTPGDLTEPRT